PVDENPCGVRMRRILEKRQHKGSRRNPLLGAGELEYLADLVSLLLQFAGMLDLAGQADRRASARQRFHQLAPVFAFYRLLIDKQPAHEFRSPFDIEVSRQ